MVRIRRTSGIIGACVSSLLNVTACLQDTPDFGHASTMYLPGVLILAPLALAFATVWPTDRQIDDLIGPVRSVEEERAELKTDGAKTREVSRRLTRAVNYDRSGRMTHRSDYISPLRSTTMTFHHETSKDGESVFRKNHDSLTVLKFDTANNVLDERRYLGDQPKLQAMTQRYEHFFDPGGRLIEIRTWGFLDEKAAEVLRRSQNLPRNTPVTLVLVRTTFTYDSGPHPTERNNVDFFGNKTSVRYTYTLDTLGNWIKRVEEVTLLRPAGKTERTEVTYRNIRYY